MTVADDLRAFLRALLPRGSFWQGAAAERFLDGMVNAFTPTAERIQAMPGAIAPFGADRPVLLQWYDFLAKVDCVAVPVDTEELRARVLALLAAESVAFPAGLDAAVLAYLPLVELDDLLPLSILGWNPSGPPALYTLPAPLDPWWAVVEAWYPPTLIPEEQLLCVLRPFLPGVAVARPTPPAALWHLPAPSVPSTVASDLALHWREMRADTELVLERRLTLGLVLLESVTIDPVDVAGVSLASDLFPLLSPGSTIGGQTFIAKWTRTWANQTSKILADTTRAVV